MRSVLCVVVSCVIGLGAVAGSPEYSVFRLTDYKDFGVGAPDIDGGRIVWSAPGGVMDSQEIMLIDGALVTNLSNRPEHDFAPRISGDRVVWFGHDGEDYEIFLSDGSGLHQVTDNDRDDVFPSVSDSYIAWIARDGSDYDVFMFDGAEIRQLTDNVTHESPPEAHGSQVFWSSEVEYNLELFAFDGGEIRQLTTGGGTKGDLRTDGRRIVFGSFPGWISVWQDGVVSLLNDRTTFGFRPDVDGELIVWAGGDLNPTNVFVHDGARIFEIEDDVEYADDPAISDGTIVFLGKSTFVDFWQLYVAVPFGVDPPPVLVGPAGCNPNIGECRNERPVGEPVD